MLHSSESKQVDSKRLFDFFESRISGLSEASQRNYRIVVNSLKTFLSSRQSFDGILTDRLLADWYVYVYMQQLSSKTLAHYVDYLSSLHRSAEKEGIVPSSEVIKAMKVRVNALESVAKSSIISKEDFVRLLNLAKVADKLKGETALRADILLMSLVNGAMPLIDVARLRRADLAAMNSESQTLAERHVDPKRRYVFPLGQPCQTVNQLRRNVYAQMADFLKSHNIPVVNGSAEESMASLWAYAALECGASASQVVARLGRRPAGIPALALSAEPDDEIQESAQIEKAVARMLLDNPMQWFAMRMRPGVTFDQLERRFELLADELQRPEMFYPCEEIAKKIGRKLVYRDRPLISDVVFFRSRPTDVYPLLRQISDLAWCYRENSENGSRYAAIPSEEMHRFQTAIGQFTSDYEFAPAGGLEPREGDRVVIIGGAYAGNEATFLRTIPSETPDASTIYRVAFFGGNGFEWRMSLDSRLVKKA